MGCSRRWPKGCPLTVSGGWSMRVVLTRREPLDSPDGVSIFIVSLAQALCDLGHGIEIVAGSCQEAEFRRLLAPRIDLPILALSRTTPTGPASIAAWLRAKWAIDHFGPPALPGSLRHPLKRR